MEQKSFQLLFSVYLISSLISILMMTVFYIHQKRNKRFGYLILAWVGILVGIILDAFQSEATHLTPIIAYWPEYLTSFGGVLLMGSLFQVHINRKILLTTFVATFALSLIFYFSGITNFTIIAAPMALGVGFPLIITAIICLYRMPRNTIYDLYLFLNIMWGLHFADYAILREQPDFALFGFTFSFLITLTLSMIFPFIINMKQKEESEKVLFEKIEEKKFELQTTVTNLINAQTKLIEQEKFISLATLTSGIAHEIRNPLNIILNAVKILEKEVERELDRDEKKDLIDLISSSTLRANNIIKNMLLKTNQLTNESIESERFLLKELIDDCLEKTASKEDSNITLDIEVPDYIFIKGQRTDLESIFINLITNSLYSLNEKKLLHPQEMLSLRIKAIHQKNRTIIQIEDSGMGVKEEQKSKVFEPFFTTKPTGVGTGLGLSIIRIMLSGIGGSIELESEASKFCRFTINLPIV